jgi:hypothetical protein
VRHLEQNAGTVACARVRCYGTPMREIIEELEGFLDDLARANAVDMSDETDSTRVMLIGRIV